MSIISNFTFLFRALTTSHFYLLYIGPYFLPFLARCIYKVSYSLKWQLEKNTKCNRKLSCMNDWKIR